MFSSYAQRLLLRASHEVSRQDWREFTFSQELLERFKGIQGVGYIWIDADTVSYFLLQKEAEGFIWQIFHKPFK